MENLLLNASVAYRSAGKPPVVWGFPPGASIIDTVPEDMLEMIHPHWKKFPPVNPMWHYLLVSSSHFPFPICMIQINQTFLFQKYSGPHLHCFGNHFHHWWVLHLLLLFSYI
jgi:hypothetical protein